MNLLNERSKYFVNRLQIPFNMLVYFTLINIGENLKTKECPKQKTPH